METGIFLANKVNQLSRQLRDLRVLDKTLVTEFPYYLDIFIVAELKMMEDVLRNNFVVAWDEIDLRDCVRGSLELSRTITQYIDMGFKESWSAVIIIRLEEKSIASNRALLNLERMHHAYSNAVPLLNHNATLNDSYESFYLTSALFNQTTEELDVYSRLVGHLKRYIGCIEGLIRNQVDAGHSVSKYKNELLNHTKGLVQASVEYVKLLDVYKSLVIRQPLQRITKAKNIFEYYKSLPDVYAAERSTIIEVLRSEMVRLFDAIYKLFITEVSDAITKYVYNMRKQRPVSKINITNIITSNRIPQILEETEIAESTYEEHLQHYKQLLEYFNTWNCLCITEAKTEPLLLSFYTKVYNHYNTTTSSDRATMRTFFKFFDDDDSPWDFILGDEKCSKMVDEVEFVKMAMNNYIDMPSLRHVNSIMKRLQPFLEKNSTGRIIFKVFRYINHCTFDKKLPQLVIHSHKR